MSWLDEANKDAMSLPMDAAATGRRVGFLDAFEVGYQSQVRGSAMYGIERSMYDLDDQQAQTMRRAGIEDVPSLSEDAVGFFGSRSFSGKYMDVARFFEDGGEPGIAQSIQEYDAKIDVLRKRYPGLQLRSSREMWDETRAKAQEYEYRSNYERRTTMGSVGAFAGAAVGALNVRSDPLNFLTAPIGGAGKSILTRVAGQAIGQGVIEALNQVTGVQAERRLLGLDHGFYDGLTRVGGAALGGAALQGVGEAAAFGFRKFFRDVPGDRVPRYSEPYRPPVAQAAEVDKVPPGVIPQNEDVAAAKLIRQPQSYVDYLREVSPWSVSRLGKARTVLDLEDMAMKLNDWTSDAPHTLTPKTDTAMPSPRGDFNAPDENIFDRVARTPNYDEVARQVDPRTFSYYDRYADHNTTYRRWLDELAPERDQRVETGLKEIDDKISELEDRMTRSGKMKQKKQSAEIERLKTEREAKRAELVNVDTPDMARVRREIVKNDEKMRELAPVVSRAYARARGKWDNTEADRSAVNRMIRDGRKSVEFDPQAARVAESIPQSLHDKVPMLREAYKVEAGMAKDHDAADMVTKIIAANEKALEPDMEAFSASVKKILADADKTKTELKAAGEEAPPNEVTLPDGRTLHLDDDFVMVPTEDGAGKQITIRELLKQQDEADENLQAVATCSIK